MGELLVLVGTKGTKELDNIIEENKHMKQYIMPERSIAITESGSLIYAIAKAVNQGESILLLTESYYMLMELNALIMLSRGTKEEKEKYCKEFNIDINAILSSYKVHGYEVVDGELKELLLEEEGLISDYIDNMIRKYISMSDGIFYGLKEARDKDSDEI